MLEVAQRSSAPYVLACAPCFVASHDLTRGDGAAAQKHAEKAMALIDAFGFESLSGLVIANHGAGLIAQGRYEEGIAGLRRSISAFRATGATPQTWVLCSLAASLGKVGRPQQGLQVLEEGFGTVARTGAQLYGPSLHRVKGELLLALNPSDIADAEQCFRTGDRNRPAAKRENRGVTRHDEPRAIAQQAGAPRSGAHDAHRHLRLVHRGLRYRGSERRQGADRRTVGIDSDAGARSATTTTPPMRRSA